jgi:DNA-binding LytR/AlgR family response regulator
MISLIFLQSASQQESLCKILKQLNVFSHVFGAESVGHCLALAEKYPQSVGFYSVSKSSRNLATKYWLAVGENDEEALLAFSHNASGFVTLPIDENQLLRAIDYVKNKYHFFERDFQFNLMVKGLCEQHGVSEPALLATLRRQLSKCARPNIVGIRADDGWCCLDPSDIKWIEAAGDYMCIYTLSESYVVRTTLCELLKRLGERHFKRCNRSVAVNAKYVAHVEQRLNQQRVVMQGGETFKITHKYFYQFWHVDRR